MDLFGIGAAVQGAMEIYFRSARCTGRTLSMVESVKDGDRIVFNEVREADRVKVLLREREVDVECIVVRVHEIDKLFQRGSSIGRTIFDHGWLEERYLYVIDDTRKSLDRIERETSGYGAAHRETRRQASEISKWLI